MTLRRLFMLPATALLLAGAPALAQNNASNPALNTSNTAHNHKFVAASALSKGANSFTQGEAQSRLQAAGLKDVTDLKKDNDGIWRGKAQRDGKAVSVGLDFKGEISAE